MIMTPRLRKLALTAKIQDEVENLDTAVGKLKSRLKEVRALGYVYGRELDDKIATTVRQWPALRSGVKAQIAKQAPDLQAGLKPLEVKLANVKRRREALTEQAADTADQYVRGNPWAAVAIAAAAGVIVGALLSRRR